MVNQSTAAVLDPASALISNSHNTGIWSWDYGLGHHSLVAPTALNHASESVQADGTGYLSDVLRAI